MEDANDQQNSKPASEKFWANDPKVLVQSLMPFPTKEMTPDEKLNALTRLVIIISLILCAFQFKYWLVVGLAGVVLIVLAHGLMKKPKKEGFTLVPTYQGLDLHETTVAPVFSEEWQVYPPVYDVNVVEPPDVTFEEPMSPQSYPYGQYLTKTNLLPSDELHTHMLNGGAREAREYANGAFLRHTLAFRDNMTKLYKKRLERRFRHSCNDTFSPYSSY